MLLTKASHSPEPETFANPRLIAVGLAALQRAPGPADPGTPSARGTLLAIAMIGLVYRLLWLGRRSLWFDELLELERASLPWIEALRFT